MFLVFNKQKIYTYLLSVLTVAVLLFVGGSMTSDESVETSSNASNLLPIYSVQTDKNQIALTINCAW